ncbi:PREDICTED: probable ATP-dependent DNA helicase CHR12 [Camelina sativa]|uniref:Probable ATP-dependent DNA helicase CHR12 n=1 Tax=Camelina sativa TaxID=90675 RepID=A0ABM0WAE7_CAMSA|nr:PREDICTED: probable ATP-dependent DNA helicase CHR12 [Camelina sativa]
MVAQQLQERCEEEEEDPVETTKSLICALNYISRDLPLPPHLFASVSSIYHGPSSSSSSSSLSHSDVSPPLPTSPPGNNNLTPYGGDLMGEFEDALLKQRPNNSEAGSRLRDLLDNRNKCHIQRRLSELEELPSTRGEDLQAKCLLELYGLKLRELQTKVRTKVSSEFWLRLNCADVSSQLFDWGMMRLPRPFYGVGDPFAMEADDQFRKKRDAERLLRLEEEEKNLIETSKRKFFAEVLNAVREFQLQIQATQKRRRQRNDGVQAWHGRQRQRATRAEKLRLMALKSDDQEAYMKLVKESKNERLTTLLEETNKLLANLGAAVQRQKDAKLPEGIDLLKDSESDLSELDAPRSEPLQDLLPDQDIDITESDNNDDSNDLLEGQRQYNSAIHSIQEKVTEQPSLLEGGELRSYQIEGLQWMVSLFNNNLNGILADEMGLGKTIQTISLIAYLLENKGVPGPYLIVAPKAVLPNWVNEFATWVPSIAAFLYDGRLEERKAIREKIAGEGKFNVLITHYDLIMRDKAFLKKIEWYYMIVDEGHRLKNHESALAKTLLTGYRIKRRLLLTGTPIQNSLQELWSLLNFLLPHIFNSVQNFEEWFNAPFADRANVSLTDEEELLIIHRLHHVIRPFILRRKKDEVEKFLPGKTQVILKCDMSAWQKVYYKQVTDMGRVGLQTDQRGLLLKQFNEPDSPYFMFLLSTRAGGLGLNLQTADTVIIFDSDWNPQMDQQAEDRAHRIGQKKEVRVFVLVSVGSVEEVILERAKQKMGIDAKVIQAGLFNTTSTAQDRREMLEEIMRKGTSSLGTDVPSEREINRLAARSEDEFWMFERMDEERRRKENYRARLMQEQEVPEWAYTTQSKDDKLNSSKFHFGSVTGKRKRKEIVYSDTLSESQWLKAVESGEDLSKLTRKHRRGEKASNTKTPTSKKAIESIPIVSDGTSEEENEEEDEEEIPQEMSGKQRVEKSEEEEEEEDEGEEENDGKAIFKWNTYKKKRSRYSFTCSSSDSRAQSSNGSRRK